LRHPSGGFPNSWSRRVFAYGRIPCRLGGSRGVVPHRQGASDIRRRMEGSLRPSHRTGGPTLLSGRAGSMRRSEEHTSELQSREKLVCRLLLEKKNSNEKP